MPFMDYRKLRRRITVSVLLLVAVLVTGTVGYSVIEGWTYFESLYMTVITMTTIGYEEVHTLSKQGRLFTLFLIFFGVGVAAYTINYGIRFIIEGEIREALGRRKMEKRLMRMKNHYIVCGFGRMGRIICRELKSYAIPIVVVEAEPVEETALDRMPIIVQGDATRDDVLKEAGIERAKGLISVLSTDANNLYVVLSARGLNPSLHIVARAGEEGSERKLVRAGADRVVSPYYIGGLRIAHSILKPSVVDFIEFATRSGNIELRMEEIPVHEGSRFNGLTIDKTGIGRDLGIIIVAIKRAEDMRFNPPHGTVIRSGDTLIALGEAEKIKELEKMV